jgi:nitrile hydratase accessory protein
MSGAQLLGEGEATSSLASAQSVDAAAFSASMPERPTFAAPWQARAFAMTLSLHKAGVFTWAEWAAALSEELHEHQNPALCGDDYYHCWVEALDHLVQQKQVASGAQIDALAQAWHEAAERTPHGEPVSLAQDVLRTVQVSA